MTQTSSNEWKQLFGVMNSYISSLALFSAVDFDLFSLLEQKKAMTLDEIAQELNITPYAARVMMLGICYTELVQHNSPAGTYSNTPAASQFLVDGKASSMLSFVKFNSRIQMPCTLHLTESIKESKNVGLKAFPGEGDTLYQRLQNYPDLENLFQNALSAYSTNLISPLLSIDQFGQVTKLLDVGGGDATTAIALCEKHKNLNVTILETKNVAAIGKEKVLNSIASGKIDYFISDAFKPDWPKNYDAILMSHFAEIFSPEKIYDLYKNAHNALDEHGRLFIWAATANEVETGGLQAAKSSLYFLATASGGGMTYPLKDHIEILRKAGFQNIETISAEDIEHTCIIARK